MLLREAKVIGVEEVVTESGRVQHQHAGGDVALRRPQPRIAACIESFEPFELAQFGSVFWIEAPEFDDIGYFDTLEEAKGAAEANYEPYITEASEHRDELPDPI